MKHKTMIASSILLVVAASAFLSACASPATSSFAPTDQNTATPLTSVPTEATPGLAQPNSGSDAAQPDLTRTDDQGMVEIAVQPTNLSKPGETLDFEISMNTHSVDLSMDLTTLATLTTDTGKTVQPLKWDAPSGGHHVSGKLSFPAKVNGSALLDGAKRLTLTIKDVDAPERTFVWELGS